MRIVVNGDPTEVASATLAALLAELGYGGSRLATAVDGDFVPAARREAARLREDCRVEIVRYGRSPGLSLPYDLPALGAAKQALRDEWGREPVTIGSGGSIPVVGDFKRVLGLDTLLIGFTQDDDRMHSPNEKYDLQSFHKGARSWARILAALAADPAAAQG